MVRGTLGAPVGILSFVLGEKRKQRFISELNHHPIPVFEGIKSKTSYVTMATPPLTLRKS